MQALVNLRQILFWIFNASKTKRLSFIKQNYKVSLSSRKDDKWFQECNSLHHPPFKLSRTWNDYNVYQSLGIMLGKFVHFVVLGNFSRHLAHLYIYNVQVHWVSVLLLYNSKFLTKSKCSATSLLESYSLPPWSVSRMKKRSEHGHTSHHENLTFWKRRTVKSVMLL